MAMCSNVASRKRSIHERHTQLRVPTPADDQIIREAAVSGDALFA
jgi:hypothetical protein